MNKYIISIFLLILVIIISQGMSFYLENNIQECMMNNLLPDYISNYKGVLMKDVIPYNIAISENNNYDYSFYHIYDKNRRRVEWYNLPEYKRQLRKRRRFFDFSSRPRYPYYIPPYSNEKIKELYEKAKRATTLSNDIDNAFQSAKNTTSVAISNINNDSKISTDNINNMKDFLTHIKLLINGPTRYIYKMVYICISIPLGFASFIRDDEIELYTNNELQAKYSSLIINKIINDNEFSTYSQILDIFTIYKSIQHLFNVTIIEDNNKIGLLNKNEKTQVKNKSTIRPIPPASTK